MDGEDFVNFCGILRKPELYYYNWNFPLFNLIINENNSSIQVSGYLGLDTWILTLSNYPMFGYLDSLISLLVSEIKKLEMSSPSIYKDVHG